MTDHPQADLVARVLAALGHPNRVRILECLRDEIRCNCEIAPCLNLEQSNLSRHLKVLVEAGILTSWKVGLRVNYKVTDKRVYRILDLATALAKSDVGKKMEVLEEA